MNSITKRFLWVFTVSFFIKVAYNILFYLRFGTHAVYHVETWFYTGIMGGGIQAYLQHGLTDPTYWILKFIGFFTADEMHLFMVEGLSVFLSAITCAGLYLLARDLTDENGGLIAAIIYAGLLNPTVLGLTGFTHDHLQLPFLVYAMYFLNKSMYGEGKKNYVGFFVPAFLSLFVNSTSYLIWGAAAILFFQKKFLCGRVDSQKFLVAFIVASIIFSQTILPAVLDKMLGDLPQGRYGSADIVPLTFNGFYLGYHIFLSLTFLGSFYAYKKNDFITIYLLIVGLSLATNMSRGARILDLGVVLACAHALTNPEKNLLKKFYIPASLAILFFGLFLEFPIPLVLSFSLIGFSVKLYMDKVEKLGIALFMTCFISCAIFIQFIDGGDIVTETEYKILYDLRGTGRVLAGWDRGFMIESLSGLKAVSSPNNIEKNVHESLLLFPLHSAIELSRADVEYVLVSSKNFNFELVEGKPAYSFGGGLIFDLPGDLNSQVRESVTLYQLRYGLCEKYFNLLSYDVDPYTKTGYFLYEVFDEDIGIVRGKHISSIFFPKDVEGVEIILLKDGVEVESKVFNAVEGVNTVVFDSNDGMYACEIKSDVKPSWLNC